MMLCIVESIIGVHAFMVSHVNVVGLIQ